MRALGADFVHHPLFPVILGVSQEIQITSASWTVYEVAFLQEIVHIVLQMQVKSLQD